MPSTTQKAVDDALVRSKDLLRNVGFKIKGRTFVRHDGSCADVINVQSSSRNSQSSVKFTMNLGVYKHSIAQCLGKMQTTLPDSYDECMYIERVGWVVPQHGDLWWEINAGNSPEQVGDWVHGVVSEFVLPWFGACHTKEGFVEVLRTRGGWGTPDLLWALGEKELALEVLEKLDIRMPHREATIREWKAQHGIAEA